MGASLGQEATGEVFIHGEVKGKAWQLNKRVPELLLMFTHMRTWLTYDSSLDVECNELKNIYILFK